MPATLYRTGTATTSSPAAPGRIAPPEFRTLPCAFPVPASRAASHSPAATLPRASGPPELCPGPHRDTRPHSVAPPGLQTNARPARRVRVSVPAAASPAAPARCSKACAGRRSGCSSPTRCDRSSPRAYTQPQIPAHAASSGWSPQCPTRRSPWGPSPSPIPCRRHTSAGRPRHRQACPDQENVSGRSVLPPIGRSCPPPAPRESPTRASLATAVDPYLLLSFGYILVQVEVLASQLRLLRPAIDHQQRGTRLPLHLDLDLARRPDAAVLAQAESDEILLLPRSAHRLHHMHRVKDRLVDPRAHRPVGTSVLRAGGALQHVTIPCAILRWRQKSLALPEQMILHHVLVGEARTQQRITPMFQRQHDRYFLSRLDHLDGDVPAGVHVQQQTRPRGRGLSDLTQQAQSVGKPVTLHLDLLAGALAARS